MSRAFVFPGQGSQEVGMGKELATAFPAAKQVFEEVDDSLNQNLSNIIFNGPDEELILTSNAQPALMAVSMAVIRVLEEEVGIVVSEKVRFVAGHSLGEYSALTAAGSLALADSSKLLKARGLYMQKAVPVGKGAMAAILGLDLESVEEIASQAAENMTCDVANDNSEGQIVVSGDYEAVERAIKLAKSEGARRGIMLPVSAPFHCSLMRPAAEKMKIELSSIMIKGPIPPIIANVTAKPSYDPEEIRDQLIKQVTHRVKWRETILTMSDLGVTDICEVGAGKVLAGLARRIDKNLLTNTISTPAEVENFISTI